MNKEDFFFNPLNVIFKEDIQWQIHHLLKLSDKNSWFFHAYVTMLQERSLGKVKRKFALPGAVHGPWLNLLPEECVWPKDVCS